MSLYPKETLWTTGTWVERSYSSCSCSPPQILFVDCPISFLSVIKTPNFCVEYKKANQLLNYTFQGSALKAFILIKLV
jgi:hypothetical protein